MKKLLDTIVSIFNNDKSSKRDLILERKDLIPRHIAIIMDGNGRWAKKRGFPRIAGHKAGMQTVKSITTVSSDIGIECLTLYAFSTENWKRPEDEVNFLMKLPEQYIQTELAELIKNNVKVTMIGDAKLLPVHTRNAIEDAMEQTKHNTGMILNFALNYGSRLEIIEAVKDIAADVQANRLEITDIDDQIFSNKLMTCKFPDPDLLIRTSGELRLSNFLLWQLAYTEFYFSETLWPDFSVDEYYLAIYNYMKRARRYGGLK
jgi:undecaprenyl diphosphate synthase